jgi:hypothetical protein
MNCLRGRTKLRFDQLALTGVGVEKVDIHKNGVILRDRKCLGDPRKSFIGHPDATLFWLSFRS